MKRSFVLFLLVCLSLLFVVVSSCDDDSNEKLVLKIDHILIEPEDSFEFFKFLSQDLKFPVVWEYKDYGEVVTGGVYCGNVKIESLNFDQMDANSTIGGIAFDPYLSTEETIVEMEQRSISHGETKVRPFGKVTAINNLLPSFAIFFCEFANPDEIEEQHKDSQQKLEELDGGPLGVEEVIQLVVKYNDDRLLDEWKKLLVVEQISDGEFIYSESSPNIHFIKSDKNELELMVFKVKSLERTKKYLLSKNMLGMESAEFIETDPETFFGVLFRFTEDD